MPKFTKEMCGEKHYQAKLDNRTVQLIRAETTRSAQEIAEYFGIHRQTVWDIRAGRTWKHLPVETPIDPRTGKPYPTQPAPTQEGN